MLMSDLHLDMNEQVLQRSLTPEFISWLKDKPYDVLIIAGDLAGDAFAAIKLVEKIKAQTNKEVYFVAGNHDVWVPEQAEENSWGNYHLMMNHPNYLHAPSEVGDHVIIGGMGWYDYSLGMDDISSDTFKKEKKHLWKDARFARWEIDDEVLLTRFIKSWRADLEKHRNKPVMFVNHFIPYKAFLTWLPDNDKMNFCQAYMGSARIGQMLDQYSNIDYVAFGHTHHRHGMVDHHGKTIICQPLGYVDDWEGDSFVEELDKAAVIIEL